MTQSADNPQRDPRENDLLLARAENGPGPYEARGRFWGLSPTRDEVNGIENREAAMRIVSDNSSHIHNMADKYNIDSMVLASVLYQERRHRNSFDDIDEALGDPRGSTIGPGQMTRVAFHKLVEENRLELSPEQKKQYQADREGFAFNFLTQEKTGIEATAALIRANMDRQFESYGRYGRAIDNDNNPNTLSLGQYVYGAALYSSSGVNEPDKRKTGENRDFDRLGPTTEQIDLRNNDLSGLQGLNRSQSMTNAFRYLPDVYQALHGTRFEAPQNLSDYFQDTSILRPARTRSSNDEGQPQVAAHPGEPQRGTPSSPLDTAAAQFGERGQPARETFDRIAAQLQTQAPQLGEQKIAETSAELAQKSLAARIESPTVAINASGRAFAHDPANPGSPVVYSDPQTLNPDSIARNAASVREQQSQTIAPTAQTQEAPNQQQEPRSRSMG